MKKFIPLVLAAAMFVPVCANAQNPNAAGQNYRQSFEEFRKSIHRDFDNFRSRILEHYADFLRGEWHEYEPLMPQEHYSQPKPEAAPSVYPLVETDSASAKAPKQLFACPSEENHTETVAYSRLSNVYIERRKADSIPAYKVVRLSGAKGHVDLVPEVALKPGSPSRKKKKSADRFSFYTMCMRVPKVSYNIKDTLRTTEDFANQWTALSRQNVAKFVIPSLQKIADDIGLNDYLTYRLVHDYVNAKVPDADNTSRVSLMHYLLTNMGYDARLALASPVGIPLLLLPTEQVIYGLMSIDFDGKKYYAFLPDGLPNSAITGNYLYTCSLPASASNGKSFDLVLNELKIPVKARPFDLSYGKLHLTGELNENLMPILYRYPQMQMDGYARSNVQPKLRSDLVRQIQEQLGGLSDGADVEELLSFTQHVFGYATDQQFHGFEKPYFLEENLYYPLNDCEDRAIFYTYFLWNALGRKSQLIHYPGHEAATVKLDQPGRGTAYSINGEKFYISDPTYIGAHTGMVIPDYKDELPNVDYTY